MCLHAKTSLEASLRKAEQRHSISRWTTDCPQFLEIVHRSAVASKEKILRQVYQDSSSRAFLVQLLKKYSGWHRHILLVLHYNNCLFAMPRVSLHFNNFTSFSDFAACVFHFVHVRRNEDI